MKGERGAIGLGAGIVALLLGCGFSGGSKGKCYAAVELNGVRHSSVGTGSTREAARASATTGTCISYCEHGDTTVDALYQKWRSSPAGQEPGAARDKGVALGFVPELEKAVDRCEADCAALIKTGKAQVKSQCL
jgi:hypothetical protein